MSAGTQIADLLDAGCGRAIERASEALAATQHPDGYWWGDLTADTTLESDFVLLSLWLYPPAQTGEDAGVWKPANREKIDRAVKSILNRQLPDGGFNIYQEGPSEISA